MQSKWSLVPHHHHLLLSTKPPRNSPLSLSRFLLHRTVDLVHSSIELVPRLLAVSIKLSLAILEMLLALFQVTLAIIDDGGNALVQLGLGAGVVNLNVTS